MKKSLYIVKGYFQNNETERMKKVDDDKIVGLYIARNELAISCTAQKYGSKIRNTANNILKNMQQAEECENDTYLTTWNLIPPHEPRTYLLAFITKIARQLSLDICKRNNTQKRSAIYCELTEELQDSLPGANSPEYDLEAKELGEIITKFLKQYPEDQQKIFMRRYWYFDSVAEISSKYHFSKSKVKTTLFRMREDLKKYLEKGGYSL